MNKLLLPALATLALAGSAAAQSTPDEFLTAPSGRFGLSYRAALNVRASFKNLGSFPAQSNPGPATGGGVDRTYDDGFNRVDGSGNAGGLTTYWGYENAGQLPGNDTVVMHSRSVSSVAPSDSFSDDPQSGFELSYTLPLSTGGTWRWGIEAAFGFTDINLQQNQSYAGDVTQITDAYALGGIIPPVAPYAGTFSGPGAQIGDSPTRTSATTTGAAAVTSQARIDAALYQLRLGPYLEIPLGRRGAITLGGGLVGAMIDGRFEYHETAALSGGGSLSASGEGSDGDALVGGYLAGQLTWALSRHVGVNAGAQYQTLGRFTQTVGGREAELDLRDTIFVTAGLSYAF